MVLCECVSGNSPPQRIPMNRIIRVAGLIGDVHAEDVWLKRALQFLSDKVLP
jgi:hypothetical protein